MWAGDGRGAGRLAAYACAAGPFPVDAELVVVTASTLTSPLTGARGVAFVVEILGRSQGGALTSIGALVIGDTVVYADDEGAELVVVARRARFDLRGDEAVRELGAMPPEVVPLLAGASGLGVPCFREHVVRSNARYRVRAVAERSPVVGRGLRYAVRHDAGEVVVTPL